MELSRKTIDALRIFFTIANNSTYTESDNNYHDGNLGSFIKYTSSESDSFILPQAAIAKHTAATATCYLPVFITDNGRFYKTPNMLFYHLISGGSYRSANYVNKVLTTDKNEIYYGCPGVILDRDKKPLILCTVKAKQLNSYSLTIQNYNILISPRVYTSKGTLEKFLTSKIIPYILENGIVIKYGGRQSLNIRDNFPADKYNLKIPFVPNIVISEDINNFISIPKEGVDLDDALSVIKNNFSDFYNYATHK